MDTNVTEEQLDYEDDEYGGAQKMQYQGSGTIPALADDEMMGEEDDYDDLYSDVNVGESFQQLQRSEPPGGVGNGGVQTPKVEAGVSVSRQASVPDLNKSPVKGPNGVLVTEMNRNVQARNLGFQGSFPPGADPSNMTVRFNDNPAPSVKSSNGVPVPATIQPMQNDQIRPGIELNTNVNHPMVYENQIRPVTENGSTMLFVGELHWWTTDADLESVLNHYGRVKEIKFFDEKASGKSKGYCQVEFFDPSAAAACKEQMNGYLFNERACVVTFASPQSLKQMGSSFHANKNQVQTQGRRPMGDGVGRGGDGVGRGGGTNYQGGDGGRGFGRGGGWGRGGQGVANRGPGGGPPMRGRGAAIAPRGMAGNGVNSVGFGQGMMGPAFGGPPGGMNMMHPQAMMGAGFDPTFMARGGGYGGFPGTGYPGMMPSFPPVNPMGLGMVAPHVNPAFFARGMTPNGMGLMGPTGMEGHHPGMWTDPTMNGWGGGERESSYGGVDDGGSEHGYGESSQEKGGGRSNVASQEKERGSDPDRTRHRDETENDRGRLDRDKSYREDRDAPRDNNRHRERDDDWDRGQSSRPRSRSRMVSEDDHRDSRSRDVDYGKRRRLPSE